MESKYEVGEMVWCQAYFGGGSKVVTLTHKMFFCGRIVADRTTDPKGRIYRGFVYGIDGSEKDEAELYESQKGKYVVEEQLSALKTDEFIPTKWDPNIFKPEGIE